MEKTVLELWEKHGKSATWERYDFVDPPYCWAASISLEVDGFVFEGDGYIVGGTEYEIEELHCTCPDGAVINIV